MSYLGYAIIGAIIFGLIGGTFKLVKFALQVCVLVFVIWALMNWIGFGGIAEAVEHLVSSLNF